MHVYLPIAEVSVNPLLLLGIGAAVGVLSGMFGVGGGFLITPLLFLIGIPPTVAVATSANQVVASSFSGLLAHLKRRTVDLKMGLVLLIGGLFGAALGMVLFNFLKQLGQVDLAVQLCYVVFLGVIGSLMFVESVNAIRRSKQAGGATPYKRRQRTWVHALPFKMRFRGSSLYISVIPPALVGFGVGILSAIMGVGGGFIMVPAMIYILGMPTKVVIGTSLFQIIFVAGFTTMVHASTNFSVDLMLALLLILGGVVGAQLGTQIGARLKAEQLRVLLALLVMSVSGKIAFELLLEPIELYSVTEQGGIDPIGSQNSPRAVGNDTELSPMGCTRSLDAGECVKPAALHNLSRLD